MSIAPLPLGTKVKTKYGKDYVSGVDCRGFCEGRPVWAYRLTQSAWHLEKDLSVICYPTEESISKAAKSLI